MHANSDGREPPTALRGWLSDIFFPALSGPHARSVDPSLGEPGTAALARRLGGRATIDDPLFGRAIGASPVKKQLDELADWLLERQASFERKAFTTGVDRDVTEGALLLRAPSGAPGSDTGGAVSVPVAVVAERRKSREVDVRIYFSTAGLAGAGGGAERARGDVVRIEAQGGDAVLPAIAAQLVDALVAGDVPGALGAFEITGAARDGHGRRYLRSDGALQKLFERQRDHGLVVTRRGSADDGRSCALEYDVARRGEEAHAQAGVLVVERGESGLLREARFYDDVVG